MENSSIQIFLTEPHSEWDSEFGLEILKVHNICTGANTKSVREIFFKNADCNCWQNEKEGPKVKLPISLICFIKAFWSNHCSTSLSLLFSQSIDIRWTITLALWNISIPAVFTITSICISTGSWNRPRKTWIFFSDCL